METNIKVSVTYDSCGVYHFPVPISFFETARKKMYTNENIGYTNEYKCFSPLCEMGGGYSKMDLG